jgi:hypothetical protein
LSYRHQKLEIVGIRDDRRLLLYDVLKQGASGLGRGIEHCYAQFTNLLTLALL